MSARVEAADGTTPGVAGAAATSARIASPRQRLDSFERLMLIVVIGVSLAILVLPAIILWLPSQMAN